MTIELILSVDGGQARQGEEDSAEAALFVL